MRPSNCLLEPGFFRRSLGEFQRFAKLGMTPSLVRALVRSCVIRQRDRHTADDFHSYPATTLESIRVPMTPYHLLDFTDPETITICKTMSDADMGGFSKAQLDQVPGTASGPAHMRFYGSISIDLPPNRPHIQRSGYAAWRNKDRGPTLFGKSLWDVDPYLYLALRFKSDGRKYFVNVQTESIVHTDIHQHRLYSRRPREWETVFLRWADFVRTNHGEVVEPQNEMMRQKVRTLGIGLTDRVPGPFELCVANLWTTNRMDDVDAYGDEGPTSDSFKK
ncbi:MAG: hypothetical protein LQ348_000831 [Seirophora lacunosa]|nr:MAG: hypothetical protein LQ344_003920 [Seirophora lacunosa]KAI4206763.1 MAG: hypothetical protein LQ348_000831 [Seirophora lacunosa]